MKRSHGVGIRWSVNSEAWVLVVYCPTEPSGSRHIALELGDAERNELIRLLQIPDNNKPPTRNISPEAARVLEAADKWFHQIENLEYRHQCELEMIDAIGAWLEAGRSL